MPAKKQPRRDVQIKIMMTRGEHTKLKAIAAHYGISIADLVRLRSLYAEGLPVNTEGHHHP